MFLRQLPLFIFLLWPPHCCPHQKKPKTKTVPPNEREILMIADYINSDAKIKKSNKKQNDNEDGEKNETENKKRFAGASIWSYETCSIIRCLVPQQCR